ncbi:type II toxin-antitoxin system VapC family toxin [Brevundimonas sp.]|uniref:type II toxin-antitoxin system VapC family toxin n=1 Tax=Brevundimonas sp. TaxID=1871086 RepID=UPI003D10131C
MTLMLDTSVAIHLRDGDPDIQERISTTSEPVVLPMIALVELEGGVRGDERDLRRARLDVLLKTVEVKPFLTADARAYGEIVNTAGFSRRKVLDRMIAAQAITAGATLVTRNGDDFRDIPGLTLLEW